MLIWTIAVALAVAGLLLQMRRLPTQNLFAITLLILGLSAIVEACSRHWGVPYRTIASASFGALPLAWLGILLVSRRVAQAAFASQSQASNYGLRVLAGTVVCAGAIWSIALAVLGSISLWGIVARAAVAFLLLLAVFPFFIVKHPGAKGYRG